MRLKRLELFGFKSFADRTVLDFKHSVVGVVGPNGCGKSNVVDAVRWVLGEQRASSMRGGEMADVIFKGSASRPSLAIAEVTMVLDNECKTLEGRGEEVAITRRVFKSGEGEYQIDSERVRLKDVKEMLYGTGLGSRGYSFLEQGKIDAVLSANPLERRTIFEEAAGISRYRQRIKETTSKLKRVEADLLRLDDVLGELEKRERSLKIQAGRAQRYIEAKEEWTTEGLRFARHRMHSLREETDASGKALAELEQQTEAQRAARTAAERDATELQTEQEVVQTEVDRLGLQNSELAGDLRALEERVAQLGARVVAWRESAEEENQRATELQEKLAARKAQHTELLELVSQVQAEAERADGQAEELEEKRREAEARCEEARQKLDFQNKEVLELLNARTSWKNRVQHLGELLGPLAQRVLRAEERRDEARASVSDAGRAAQEAQAGLEEHQKGLETLEANHKQVQGALTERAEHVGELENQRSKLELEGARLSSRIQSLMDREREREGLERGSKGLFEGIEGGELNLDGEVRGLLADHLRVDSQDALALDAVLASRSQALVFTDRADAVRALEWLREGELGRASLVVTRGNQSTPLQSVSRNDSILVEYGVVGRLLDRLDPDAEFTQLAKMLLAEVYLVRDVHRGLELVELYPSARFVTAEGDLIDAAGLVGGYASLAHGAIGRRSHAADLEVERERLGEDLSRVQSELDREREAEAADRRRANELASELQASGRQLARMRAEVEAAGARRKELDRSVELLEREQGGLTLELSGAKEQLTRAREEDVQAEQRFVSQRKELDELEGRRGGLETERESLATEAQRARHEARNHADRLEGLGIRRADLDREQQDLQADLERAQRLHAERTQSADRGETERIELGEEREKLVESRGELEKKLAEARERERAGRDSIQELRQRGEAITGELETVLARVAEQRLAHQRLELSLEELGRRAEEDFQIQPQDLLEAFEPDPELLENQANGLKSLGVRVTELKRSMDKCGPVNLEAVDELAEVSERLGFMTTQRSDLHQARKSLEGTIQKLNEESERRFIETFEEVRASFRTIFRQLFGGGNADIMLLDEENVLDSGLEIIARPPGREALPISLLSGGQRTMTALALLFAVFRAQPSPFCILDEVDAALDDANITRFLSLLESTELGSQFIIVTHNKGTMSACDALYGVTMAVRGVSHVVAVELSDVDEFVPEATGSAAAAGAPRLEEIPPTEVVETEDVTLVPFRAEESAPEPEVEPEDEGVETAAS